MSAESPDQEPGREAAESLQRTTDELEHQVERIDEQIDEARDRLASRREEADVVDQAAGSWENRARDDEGPFGVLGGPMGEGGATRPAVEAEIEGDDEGEDEEEGEENS